MARVYVSSTYSDLKDHREAVERALRKLSGLQVICMEDYVASDERPVERCLSDVGSCDVYVGIIAWRYGFVPPNDNPDKKSITELEYREAKKAARLIFLLDPSTPWQLHLTDKVTGENSGGAEIDRFRRELENEKLRSYFKTPEELASLVSIAVSNALLRVPPSPPKVDLPHFRELRHAMLLAYSHYDEDLAKQIRPALEFGRDRPVLLSQTALFARTESQFEALDTELIRSGAVGLLLTPASLGQVTSHLSDVERVLATMSARTGAVATLLVGVQPQDLPAAIAALDCFSLAKENVQAIPAADPGFPALKGWLDAHAPQFGTRVIGLPISALAMNRDEAKDLFTTPNFIADRLSKTSQEQFDLILKHLGVAPPDMLEHYSDTREEWQPFDVQAGSISALFGKIVESLNSRKPPRLRQRHVKLQWYPFDIVKEMFAGTSPLGRIYEGVAQAGCIFVIDELSLFHPLLRDAFIQSPFFNKEQVAIVTVSPADPTRSPLGQAIETSLRNQLKSMFRRYAEDLDPQCEVAIGDRNRLLRWLYANVPEAIANLREPRANQETLAMFRNEHGPDRPTGGDYPWAGGPRS